MSELTKNFDASLLDKLEHVVVHGYIAEEHFKSLLTSVVGEKITDKINNGSLKVNLSIRGVGLTRLSLFHIFLASG